MDNNIYDKLTESAKLALNETVKEVSDMVLEKAYKKASLKNTADKEISLRDIVEAREEILYQNIGVDKLEFRKKRLTLMLSMTGAAYATFGIIFYLYQNKAFDRTKDIGLIIAALGILISIISFYYTQLTTKQKVNSLKDSSFIEKDNSEFEIVRRWQTIEKLGTELMLKEGVSDNKAKSFSSILNFVSERLIDTSKTNNLKKILMIRNEIVHGGISLSKNEIENIIKQADQIIDELENKTVKH